MHNSLSKLIGTALTFAILLAGCSSDQSMKEAPVYGQITVADSMNQVEDYSGIGVTILSQDSTTTDTLFDATTDSNGQFSGKAIFPEKRQYALVISKNSRPLGQAGVILAEGDSLQITAQMPDIDETLELNSREHVALENFRRVNQNFERVIAYGQAGRLKGDSLSNQLQNWPGIFWQVYQENENTLASHFAAERSIELLNQLDQQQMMQKLKEIEDNDELVYLAASYGKNHKARTQNLDEALSYLQQLESKTESSEANMRIQMERINLLYDSSRVSEALTALNSFKNEFDDNEMASEWAASVEYDLNYLSSGDAIPAFSFSNRGGDTISREELKGTAYLLEITPLTNPMYQQQYDRTSVIYSIYKNYDFEIVTMPLDSSQSTIDQFFENRVRAWPVADAAAFDRDQLIELFNVQALPLRFLVDQQGRIVRRFEGDEYQEVIQEIQQIINTN